jgi:hypothetical protein
MGWVSALGREVGRMADAPPVRAALPDVQTAAVGGGIGGVLPAETTEDRARNILMLGGGSVAARRLAPGRQTDVQPGGFAGPQARTADLDRLERAQAMEGAGMDPRQIWQDTGWLKGEEGAWRFETNDQAAQFRLQEAPKVDWEFDLEEVFDAPELFAAYPELKNAQVIFQDMGPVLRSSDGDLERGAQGAYDRFFRTVMINNRLTREEVRETLLHETQHAVQDIEGFARGGMPERGVEFHDTEEIEAAFVRLGEMKLRHDAAPDDASRAAIRTEMDAVMADIRTQSEIEAYQRLPGEVEARLVERRKNMTPEQRRAEFPNDMRDMEPVTQAEPIERGGVAASQAGGPLDRAKAQGYQGADTGESAEWLSSVQKGLPMDQGARMARAKEMGFDTETVLYHGTGDDIGAFRKSDDGTRGQGVYLTPSPDVADGYASVKDSASILPLHVRGKIYPDESSDVMSDAEYSAIFNAANRAGQAKLKKAFGGKAGFPKTYRKVFANAVESQQDQNALLEKAGYAGRSGRSRVTGDEEVFIFDPSNIRSVHAAFDPDKAGSPMLLAGFGDDMVTAGLGSAAIATAMIGGGRFDSEDDGDEDSDQPDEPAMMVPANAAENAVARIGREIPRYEISIEQVDNPLFFGVEDFDDLAYDDPRRERWFRADLIRRAVRQQDYERYQERQRNG